MEDGFLGFKIEDRWDHENGFYLTAEPSRIGKLIAQYELYKTIVSLPGHVVECGVFKGASFIRFATYRDLLENQASRRLIGFDAFGRFPAPGGEEDRAFVKGFEAAAGEGISQEELEAVLAYKQVGNYELVPGNILETVPEYCWDKPELKIALLHIDVDVYDATYAILENMFRHVVKGGLILFDDYSTIAGETKAVDEFFAGKGYEIEKLSYSPTPSYLRK